MLFQTTYSVKGVVPQRFPSLGGHVGLSVVTPRVVVMEGNHGEGGQAGHCLSLAERRERFAAAREALQGLDEVTWQAPSGGGPDGLAGLMEELDALVMAGGAGQVAVLRRPCSAARLRVGRRR